MTSLSDIPTKALTRTAPTSPETVVAGLLIGYVFAFNLVPDALRLAWAGALLAGYAGLLLRSRATGAPGLMARAALALLLALALFGMLRPGGFGQGEDLLRFAAPLMGWLVFALRPADGRLDLGLLYTLCVFATAAAVLQAALHPPVIVSGTPRLGSVTGGLGAMHPSAYACLALGFCMLAFLRADVGRTWLSLACLAALAGLILGFGVRTVWLMAALAALIGSSYSERYRAVFFGYAAYGVLALALIGLGLVDRSVWQGWAELGSGRVGTYLHRLDLIAARDPTTLIFGSGLGSDLFRGDLVWRSTAKDSHNDFLTLTIELGLLGLLSGCVFLVAVLAGLRGRFAVAVGLALIAASAVSNGALFRPNLAVLFGLAIAIWREATRDR